MKYEVNSEIKVYTMQYVMSTWYVKSFYIDMKGFTCWFRISNSIDTNTLKLLITLKLKSLFNYFFCVHVYEIIEWHDVAYVDMCKSPKGTFSKDTLL